jgi:hypothetical protein
MWPSEWPSRCHQIGMGMWPSRCQQIAYGAVPQCAILELISNQDVDGKYIQRLVLNG